MLNRTANYDLQKQNSCYITRYVTPCLTPNVFLIVTNKWVHIFYIIFAPVCRFCLSKIDSALLSQNYWCHITQLSISLNTSLTDSAGPVPMVSVLERGDWLCSVCSIWKVAIRAWKYLSDLDRIQTHDLWDSNANNLPLSYKARWEVLLV